MSLGAAANDAVWSASAASWVANSIGIGIALIWQADNRTLEVQLKVDEPLSQGTISQKHIWHVVTAPFDWYGRPNQQLLRDNSADIASGLATALTRLQLHYGGTCELPSSDPYAIYPVDDFWGRTWITCNASGWASPKSHEIHITRTPVNAEERDGLGRVLYSNSSFVADSTDPDNNRGPMYPNAWQSVAEIQWAQELDTGEMQQFNIAAATQGVAIRSYYTADEAVYDVRTMLTNSARVPTTFSHESTAVAPWDLPSLLHLLGLQGVTNPTTPPASIQFPSDYARQGEAQAAADSIKARLENTQDINDPVMPSEFAHFGDTFNNLLGWQLPSHNSQCPTSSFQFLDNTYVIDTHCQLINDHFDLFRSVMAVVFVLLALFVVMRA